MGIYSEEINICSEFMLQKPPLMLQKLLRFWSDYDFLRLYKKQMFFLVFVAFIKKQVVFDFLRLYKRGFQKFLETS